MAENLIHSGDNDRKHKFTGSGKFIIDGGKLKLGEDILPQGSASSKDALIEGRKDSIDDTSARNINYQLVWDNTADGYGSYGMEYNVQTKEGNPYNMTGSLGGIMARTEHLGDGVATELIGTGACISAKGGGNVVFGSALVGAVVAHDGTVEDGVGLQGYGLTIGTGHIDKYRAIVAKNVTKYGGTVTNNIGLNIEEIVGGTNNIGLLLGTDTPPTGDWAIYSVSPYKSILGGDLLTQKYEIKDTLTYIDKDASDNMTFTDAVTGTRTLKNIGCPVYHFIKAVTQSEGDLHLSGADWGVDKALIYTIRIITSSTDWDLYILQNDNGFVADDANIPKMQIMETGNGNADILLNLPYEDEDESSEVHLYFLDNSGANTADIYIKGTELI